MPRPFSFQFPASSFQLSGSSFQFPGLSFQLPASSFQQHLRAFCAGSRLAAGSWKLAALTVTFLLLIAPHAEAAGPVRGRVVDADGRVVTGARVIATGDGPLATVLTDSRGEFVIDPPPRGRLSVRISMDGFKAAALTLDEQALSRDVGTVTLTISAVSESVVVSANQVEVPLTQVTSSVTVIDRAEIESRQLHSVADALRTVPGMTVAATGGPGATTGLFPRGGESNYTLVLIDGVPANSFGGDFDFAHLSTVNVERIEVVRGPQSALFGSNAIGAVVRITSRRGGPPTAGANFETGQFGSSRVSASSAGSYKELEWGASFDQLESDGMNGERLDNGLTVDNDDYTRRAGGASAGWRRGASWVRGDLHYGEDERGFPGPYGSNPIGVYEGIDLVSRGDNTRTVGGVAFFTPLSPLVRLRGQAGFNRYDSDFTSPFGASDAFSRRWTAGAQMDVALGRGLDLSGGLEVQGEKAGSTFITGASDERMPVKRFAAGYFAEARWSSNERVFVTAGIRLDDIRRDALEAAPLAFTPRPPLPEDVVLSTNPRLAAAWIVRSADADYTKIRAAIGTGIRPPDGFELAFTDNPGLKPERSRSAEAGVDHAFMNGHAVAEATMFTNHYDDLIVAVGSFSGASRFRTDNISNARASGLELALTLRGRVRGAIDLAGRVGYTALDTEILAVDQNDAAPPPFTVGQALLRRPPHQFFADASVAAGRATAFIRGNGRSTDLDVEPSFGTFGGLFDAPGYNVWSTGVTVRTVRFLDVYARIENLFNRTYEEAFGFPALGRRLTVGLRVAAGR
jgi:outer membrane cobalamin receptor